MKYQFGETGVNLEDSGERDSDMVVLLIHGFTGSSEDWNEVRNSLKGVRFLLVDLPGHGRSDSPSDLKYYSQENLVKLIEEIRNELGIKKLIIIGYSMGGRLALSYAVKYPDNLRKLIIESGHAGLMTEEERSERTKQDVELAEFIDHNEIDDFVDFWMSKDIFQSQSNLPESDRVEIRNRKLQNNNMGLSNMLKGFGTGRMIPLWDKLKKIRFETLLIAGELDVKYCEVSKKIQNEITNSRLEIIEGAGHNVHLEKRDKFINLINDFIKNDQENNELQLD
ncbi:MAG: 2-succinyl-6-hydroxy-2,4-cyclohexadiene-1-carboxylate synthase [Ignavibacteriaceae bacterium]